MPRNEAERPRTPGEAEREREREAGQRFSEMLRESYEASRFRAGIEWVQGSEAGGDADPDEAA